MHSCTTATLRPLVSFRFPPAQGGPKRPFVQTFFLAVQEKGFYVMNDMFRWAALPLSEREGS